MTDTGDTAPGAPTPEAPTAEAPTAESGDTVDRTRVGRAIDQRWRSRRRGVDAGAVAAQAAAFAAGIGRSVIGRRLAGDAVAVADASGLPARPPAAAWRMNEVEDDRRVDTPMPDDLSALRQMMRARRAAQRPVRVDLPARGLPRASSLGVSSSAGPRTGPLAAGVRYQPRSVMVDRPPEVAAASSVANPIAPSYGAQPTLRPAAVASAGSAPDDTFDATAPRADDGLDGLRRLRAAREAQAAAARGDSPPADRDRPPAVGSRPPEASEPTAAAASASTASASTSMPTTTPSATNSRSVDRTSPAGGIAFATTVPLRRQRPAAAARARRGAAGLAPRSAATATRPAGTTGLPVGAPTVVGSAAGTGVGADAGAVGPTGAGVVAHPDAVATSATSATPSAPRPPVAGRVGTPSATPATTTTTTTTTATSSSSSSFSHWPTPAAALAHHDVARSSAPSAWMSPAARSVAGASAIPTRAGSSAATWLTGDPPPVALRPFGRLTGPRPEVPAATPTSVTSSTTSWTSAPAPGELDRFVAPALRLVAGPDPAAAATGPTATAASPEGSVPTVLRRTPATASPGTASAAPAPSTTPASPARSAAAAASTSSVGRPDVPAAGRATPTTSSTTGTGFPFWPPAAAALEPQRVLAARAGAGLPRRATSGMADPTAAALDGATRFVVPAVRPAASFAPAAEAISTSTSTATPRSTSSAPTRSASTSPVAGPATAGPAAARPDDVRWPHWPVPERAPAAGGRSRRARPMRPPARPWTSPVDAPVDAPVADPGWAPGAPPAAATLRRTPAGAAAEAGGTRAGSPSTRPARTHAAAAARFDEVLRRQAADPLVDLPAPFKPLARALVGDRRVRVSVGPTSQAALAAAGHVAATVGTTIHLAERLTATEANLDIVAHELTHVAAAPSRRGPRFFDDEKHDEEEGIAATIGRMARSLLPAGLTSLFGGGDDMKDAPPAPPALPMAAPPGGAALLGAVAAASNGGGSAPPAPPLPSNTGTTGLPVGGASGFLQALSGSLAPGAPPAPRPTSPAAGSGTPPPPPPAPGGLAAGPASVTPPAPSAVEAPAALPAGGQPDHLDGWGAAAGGGRRRTAAELGFPGSVPLPVRDTTISTPSIAEESEIRRLVALIEKRVIAELERRGGRGNGLGGNW